MMTLNGNNADTLRTWAAENKGLALAALAARAMAELEAERVKAYTMPIFARYSFTCEDTGEAITDPKNIYRAGDSADELSALYFAEVCEADRANGFDGPRDCCPALMAHTLQIDAERELLLSFGAFSGVGDRFATSGLLGAWDKALDLALSACLAKEIV